jgi:hypothetical protein
VRTPIRPAGIASFPALGFFFLFATAAPVLAGSNGGGSIIVHTNDTYTWDDPTVCTTTLGLPASCAGAVTRTDKATGVVIWFLAAFESSSVPDVRTVYFGMNFDELNLGIDGHGHCGSGLELPEDGWPSNTTGSTWGFYAAQTSYMFPLYWFLVSELGEPVTGEYFCSAANATGAYASFVDSVLREDIITRFGCVHWYEVGSNTCPAPPPTGACCLSDATCRVGRITDCVDLGGAYQGDNTICDHPCSACCYWSGDPALRYCVVTGEIDCNTGTWSQARINDGFGHVVGSAWSGVKEGGVGYECAGYATEATTKWYCEDPRHCSCPAQPATWGQLKAMYR